MRRGLDSIDLKILRELQGDGRITNQALSERVGLSPRPCLDRVRRLEREGVIERYQAVVDLRKLQPCVLVLAQVALVRYGKDARTPFERCLAATPEVVECFEVSGEFDYVAKIVCPDLEAYGALTTGWTDDQSLGVARIISNFVLRTVRDQGAYPLFGENGAIR